MACTSGAQGARSCSRATTAGSTARKQAQCPFQRKACVMGNVALAVHPTSSGMRYRKVLKTWWRREDSNLRHGAYETPALPPELRRRVGGPSSKLTGLRLSLI